MFRVALQLRTGRRHLHDVPVLKNHINFLANGINGLYSPSGYKSAWLDYQKYLTTNLTLNTTGTENESRSTYQILLLTAKQTTEQHTFHYASQAHNNHLFFEQLTHQSDAEVTKPSRFLMERLDDQNINSVEDLKQKVAAMADSVLGQGWIFLVELPDKSTKLMLCNNDGTPYYYGKNQSLDLNGSVDENSYNVLQSLEEKAKTDELDFTLPLLAINLWDVAHAEDYGINGRGAFLSKVWDCINWEVVNKRMFQV